MPTGRNTEKRCDAGRSPVLKVDHPCSITMRGHSWLCDRAGTGSVTGRLTTHTLFPSPNDRSCRSTS